MDENKPPLPTPVGTFQINCTLTDKRVLVLSGHIMLEDTPADVNARIDALMDVADRQVIRADVVAKEAEIAARLAGVEAFKEHCAGLVEESANGKKLSAPVKRQLENQDTQLRDAMIAVGSLRAAVEAGKRKLNGAAA